MKSYLAGQASLFPFWCTHFTQSFHINPPGKLRTVLLFTIAAWTSVRRSTYYKDAQYMSQTWQTTCAWEMKRGWLTDINRPTLLLLPVKIERARKKNTSCLLSDYPTSTWSINSSHFVLLQTKHVFQICPCNSFGTSQFVCVEPWACRKAAALLTATVGKASRQNSVTPSKRVDGFQVLS